MASTETDRQYFDLHTRGVGYLNRHRIVKCKGGQYDCVKIVALAGDKSSPDRIPFDSKITGKDAKNLCADHAEAINDYDTTVMVGFVVDGVTPNSWTSTKGETAGELQLDIKCRLIRLQWLKIRRKGESDFTMVYKYQRPDDEEADAKPAQTQETQSDEQTEDRRAA